MAKQTGIIKLKGTIGGISFYKTSDGHLAREKGGVEASRIKNDPAFQRTRENGAEFGRAGKGGKTLRNAIRLLLQNAKDKRVVSRLTTEMLKVVKTDTTNERGLRTVQDGTLDSLVGFDFNLNGKLASTIFAPYTKNFDRAAGDSDVSLAPFSPKREIAAPSGTTHVKIVMGIAEVDFANETFVFAGDESAMLPYTAPQTAQIDLSAAVTANSTLPAFQVLGVEFYQEVNGEMYSLRNGAYNALAIVDIDVV